MISKFEWLYVKAKIKKLGEQIAHFEAGETLEKTWDEIRQVYIEEYKPDSKEIYEKWQKWSHMTSNEKATLIHEWNKYYMDCSNSQSGKMFWSLYPRFKKGDWLGIKEEVEKYKQEEKQPKIKKPSSIDPSELVASMGKYFEAKSELRQLRKTYDEYQDVYRSKEEQKNSLI